MEHLRIYVPVSDDIEIEPVAVPDTATMTALGYANMNSTFASFYGKSQISILITLHGDDTNKVRVEVDGSDAGATSYSYNKSTGALTIQTSGSASGYTYGTLTGTLNRSTGTITGLSCNGSIKTFINNNGSITCSEQ